MAGTTYTHPANAALRNQAYNDSLGVVFGTDSDSSIKNDGSTGLQMLIADNDADSFEIAQSTNVYFHCDTRDNAELVQSSKRLVTTDGVASGTARIVGGVALSDPAASTAVTGATETVSVFDHGTYTLPADSLKVGTMVRIRAGGLYTATTGSEDHIFAVRVGSANAAVTGAIDPADNSVFDIEFVFTCRSVGASGTITGTGRCLSGARATAAPVLHMLATGTTSTSTMTVDTTGSLVLAVAVDRQASATDGDSMRLDYFVVEVIG